MKILQGSNRSLLETITVLSVEGVYVKGTPVQLIYQLFKKISRTFIQTRLESRNLKMINIKGNFNV